MFTPVYNFSHYYSCTFSTETPQSLLFPRWLLPLQRILSLWKGVTKHRHLASSWHFQNLSHQQVENDPASPQCQKLLPAPCVEKFYWKGWKQRKSWIRQRNNVRKEEKESESRERKSEKERRLRERRNVREHNRKSGRKRLSREREMRERLLQEIEDGSGSDDDDAINVSAGNCYACESPYDSDLIQCSNCFRRFHLACVSDQIEDGMDELPFECNYC